MISNLEHKLLAIGHDLKARGYPTHYENYLVEFRSRFPMLRNEITTESLTRKLRKMRKNNLMITPPRMQGHFVPSGEL